MMSYPINRYLVIGVLLGNRGVKERRKNLKALNAKVRI